MFDLELLMTSEEVEEKGSDITIDFGNGNLFKGRITSSDSKVHTEGLRELFKSDKYKKAKDEEKVELVRAEEAKTFLLSIQPGLRIDGVELRDTQEDRVKVLSIKVLRKRLYAEGKNHENFRNEELKRKIEQLGKSSSGTVSSEKTETPSKGKNQKS